jgi:hypothetical protein
MTRVEVFTFLRAATPNRKFTLTQVTSIDATCDALGIPDNDESLSDTLPVLELTAQDFADAAKQLGCSVAQIRGVFEVEASGNGWFNDVRGEILAADGPGGFIDGKDLPKILFEAHIFHRETSGRFRADHPNLSSPSWNRALYVGGQGEYARLAKAMTLDRTAALRSASWGAAQIMGFNHKLAGFDTVDAFVNAMKTGSRAHLMAFVNFVQNSGLAPALRKITGVHDSARDFARGYNGKAYEVNQYHVKIARAVSKWSKK